MPLQFAEAALASHRYPLIIRHLLDGALSTAADQTIIYRDKCAYSYREFNARIGKLASTLAGLGAQAGDTIAVMDWDSHRYLEAFFAIPMMGAVLQTVNVRLPVPQIIYTLRQAKARILVVHHDFYPMIEEILPLLSDIKAVIAINDGHDTTTPQWANGEYEQLSAAASSDYPFQDFDEDALATIFFTTGTTGTPKGVSFSHRQIVLHTLALMGLLGTGGHSLRFGNGDVYMPLTPMFHVHAWGIPYVATMLGLKQIYPGRYEAEMICQLRQKHKVSFSHCVPTVVQMLLQAGAKTGADLEGWKMIIGGSALSRTLYAEGQRRGMRLFAAYGMSETAPLISITRPRLQDEGDHEATANTLTAAGIPGPLVKARIVDEAMNELPHDGITRGELVVRTPWLTVGYHGDPQASETLWQGGWLHTQDIATIDADGYIRIRDRLKDVIKTGGEWLDSIHLEDLVAASDGILEAAVVAVPDPHWGERPLAVIVKDPHAAVTLETVNQQIEEAIAQGLITRYARIERFEIVDALPRTSVGKIDKKQLRAQFSGVGGSVDRLE